MALARARAWLLGCLVLSFLHAALTVPTGLQPPNGDKDRCGSWQQDYSRLHKSILSQKPPSKIAVAVSTPSGVADRIIGSISVFYYALLAGRAIQFEAQPGMLPIEVAYEAPSIDWSRALDDGQLLDDLLQESTVDGLEPNIQMPGKYIGFNFHLDRHVSSKSRLVTFFTQSNMSAIGEGYDTVFLSSNRGMTIAMFDNPYHRQQLLALGLSPDTAFGCAFNFLFRPKPVVISMFAAELGILSRSDILKIGIHIRRGDIALNAELSKDWDAGSVLQFSKPYFKCAEELEDLVRLPGQDVVWYFLTDFAELRLAAKHRYGDKLLTSVDRPLVHTSKGQFPTKDKSVRNVSEEGFRVAVGEHWLFGMTDLQVVTERSGYGRSAAYRALKPHSVYTIRRYKSVERAVRRKCTLENFDTTAYTAAVWSGL